MYSPHRACRKRTHFWVRAHFYSKSARRTFRYHATNIRDMGNLIAEMKSEHLIVYPRPYV